MNAPSSPAQRAPEHISQRSRGDFLRWLVKSHLVEVNGFGDRLRYLQRNPQKARPNEAREVLDRCAEHAEALLMVGAGALPSVEQWATENTKQAEDAFAYGFAIATLGGEVETMTGGLSDTAKAQARYGADIARTSLPPR